MPRRTDSLAQSTFDRAMAQSIAHEYDAEEVSPFTGNLPVPMTEPLAVPSKEIIESTLVTLPARTSHRNSRGLWSFSDKVPAVSVGADLSDLSLLAPQQSLRSAYQLPRPSRKLLSYITRSDNEGER